MTQSIRVTLNPRAGQTFYSPIVAGENELRAFFKNRGYDVADVLIEGAETHVLPTCQPARIVDKDFAPGAYHDASAGSADGSVPESPALVARYLHDPTNPFSEDWAGL